MDGPPCGSLRKSLTARLPYFCHLVPSMLWPTEAALPPLLILICPVSVGEAYATDESATVSYIPWRSMGEEVGGGSRPHAISNYRQSQD